MRRKRRKLMPHHKSKETKNSAEYPSTKYIIGDEKKRMQEWLDKRGLRRSFKMFKIQKPKEQVAP